MSVLVLDAGNSIIKAKIARRQVGAVSFPHTIQKLTEAEVENSGKIEAGVFDETVPIY